MSAPQPPVSNTEFGSLPWVSWFSSLNGFLNTQTATLNATVASAVASMTALVNGLVTVPVGMVLAHAGTTAPTNFLACPTTATNISRATYSALFTAIGTTWGVGDGSTTFGIPFFSADYALIQANSNVGSSSVGAVIAHTHNVLYGNSVVAGAIPYGGSTGVGNAATASTGGSANLAAGGRVLFCIRYQ